MDYILLIYIALCCLSLNKGWNDYLSYDRTKTLRGIMAIAIVLHHISEKTNSGVLFPLMRHAGYLIVALFFFLSGYGLVVQFSKKGKSYLSSFVKNRIGYILIIWLIFTLLYLIVGILGGIKVSYDSLLLSFINGHPIVKDSWYIIVQLWMYVFFFIAFSINNIRNWCRIVIVAFLLAFQAIIFNRIGYGSIWFISNGAFVVGLAFPYFRIQFDEIVRQNWFLAFIVTSSLFLIASFLPVFIESHYMALFWSRDIIRVISTVLFVFMFIVLSEKFQFSDRYWTALGDRALEIYLIHGLVLSLFRSSYCFIKSDILWAVVSIMTSVLLAWPLHFVSNQVAGMLRRL